MEGRHGGEGWGGGGYGGGRKGRWGRAGWETSVLKCHHHPSTTFHHHASPLPPPPTPPPPNGFMRERGRPRAPRKFPRVPSMHTEGAIGPIICRMQEQEKAGKGVTEHSLPGRHLNASHHHHRGKSKKRMGGKGDANSLPTPREPPHHHSRDECIETSPNAMTYMRMHLAGHQA